jgi:hypothetical protein
MDIGVSGDGALGVLLVSIPWLLLCLVAWRGRRRRAVLDAPADVRPSEAVPDAEPLGVMSGGAFDQQDLTSAGGDAAVAPLPSGTEERLPVLSQQEQEDNLSAAIEAAKSARDDSQISRNSVELARLLLARSARPQASVLLQSAVMSARRAKLPVVHAEARVQLAELALADGDLTSACEHWQMAKLMFHEMGRRADQERMADLMRTHRCPSDWILTNF